MLFSRWLAFIILFGYLMPIQASDLADELPKRSLTVAFAENYPPFSSLAENGEATGILKDFLEALLRERLGVRISYGVYPWARGQELVREGVVDAFFTIPNDSRREYTTVSTRPLFVSDYYLYTGKTNVNAGLLHSINSLSELSQHQQLVHAHILGGGWHGTHLAQMKNVTVVRDSRRILELLRLNRVDVYIEQRPLMNYQLKQLGIQDEILEIPNVMDATQWHLCISKQSEYTMLMPHVDRLLDDLAASGELETIRQNIFNRYR